MIVQGGYNIASAYGTTQQSPIQRQITPATTANPADQVSISAAARALAAKESPLSPTNAGHAMGTRAGDNLRWQEIVLNDVKEYPSWGEQFTRDFAYDKSFETGGPLVDISAYPTVRYTYTGELVTESNLAAFKSEAAAVRMGKSALYEAEKAKGTPDVEILEKLFRYTDTQPDSYLNIIGWERAKPTPAVAASTSTSADKTTAKPSTSAGA